MKVVEGQEVWCVSSTSYKKRKVQTIHYHHHGFYCTGVGFGSNWTLFKNAFETEKEAAGALVDRLWEREEKLRKQLATVENALRKLGMK